jgi:hypothetical protein
LERSHTVIETRDLPAAGRWVALLSRTRTGADRLDGKWHLSLGYTYYGHAVQVACGRSVFIASRVAGRPDRYRNEVRDELPDDACQHCQRRGVRVTPEPFVTAGLEPIPLSREERIALAALRYLIDLGRWP